MTDIKSLPKAELHLHADGSMTPALTLQMAREKNIDLPSAVFNADKTRFAFSDFSKDFQKVFEVILKVIHSREDFFRVVYDYLKHAAEQNTLYVEIIVAPIHVGSAHLDYSEILAGTIDAIDKAQQEFGIIARIIPAIMRHYGPKTAEETMTMILNERHRYVVGVNLVGDIVQHEVKEFEHVFARAKAAGLKINAHVGEASGGPEEVWQALNYLQVDRLSHGVRAVEDSKLLQTIIDKKLTFEVCPTSNILLHMYKDYQSHPLRQLKEAGARVTLNSDDPGIFNTTLTREYEIAARYCGFSETDLLQATITAIEAAFVDDITKKYLLEQTLQHTF